MDMKKVYFARPISQYGNNQDKRDIELIRSMGFEILDPNSKFYEEAYKSRGMSVFTDLVANCDGLIFRSFVDGTIGAGMVKEINTAKGLGLFVLELPTITSKRELSVEDTRTYINQLGYR